MSKKYDHHLDSKIQGKCIQNVFQIIKTELTTIQFNATLPIKGLVIDLIENIKSITTPIVDYLRNEGKDITNNKPLFQYFINVKKLVTGCQKELKGLNLSPQPQYELSVLQKIVVLCERGQEHSEHAININIYKVKIPESDFNSLESKLVKFYYHTALKRFLDLSRNYLTFGSWVLSGSLLALLPPIHALEKHGDLVGESLQAYGDTIDRQWEQYGFACKSNLLPGYIAEQDKIDWTNPEMKIEEELVPPSSGIRILYIVDCQSMQSFIKKGTNFSLTDDGKGHTVLFKTLHSAIEFAKINNNGRFYDRIGGWRIDGLGWTPQERHLFRHSFFQQIIHSCPLPSELNKIIYDYCQDKEETVLRTLTF